VRNLRQIWQAYRDANGYLEERQQRCRSAVARDRWRRRQTINDHAFFVILFACFEDRVNTLCRSLVARKQRLRSWRHRRLWDAVEIDRIESVPFMRRASFLMDRGSADYSKVRELYDARCLIAHGSPEQVGSLNLALRYQEIVHLWKSLRP
jgi:hypothetical protein